MPKLIITISGLTGAGKTSLGERVAKDLSIKHIWKSHKTHAESSIKVVEFTKSASLDFEKSFDEGIVAESEKEDCVVTTWLSPWLVKNATARVWLYADTNSRIKRKSEEMNVSIEKAKEYVDEKDSFNKVNFKKIYGIDITDHSAFDLTLNTSKLTIDQCADIIIFLTQEETKKKFR